MLICPSPGCKTAFRQGLTWGPFIENGRFVPHIQHFLNLIYTAGNFKSKFITKQIEPKFLKEGVYRGSVLGYIIYTSNLSTLSDFTYCSFVDNIAVMTIEVYHFSKHANMFIST